MQSADISELSEAFPVRSSLIPIGGHCAGFVPSVGVWQDSPPHGSGTAIRRHWTALCLGGNRAGGSPQGYAIVPLPDHRYLIIIGRH